MVKRKRNPNASFCRVAYDPISVPTPVCSGIDIVQKKNEKNEEEDKKTCHEKEKELEVGGGSCRQGCETVGKIGVGVPARDEVRSSLSRISSRVTRDG